MITPPSRVFKTAIDLLSVGHAYRFVEGLTSGVGVFFTLRQVADAPLSHHDPLWPIKISTRQLDLAIEGVLDAGYDVVPLEAAAQRLSEGNFEQRFACFIVEDGYRDTLALAHPVFRRAGTPYAIAVASEVTSGFGRFWWLGLAHILENVDRLSYTLDGERYDVNTGSLVEKEAAFRAIAGVLAEWPVGDAFAFVRNIGRGLSFDPAEMARDITLDWEDLLFLSRDPLVSIAMQPAASIGLANLGAAEARAQLESCGRMIHRMLGIRPRHFCYPSLTDQRITPRDTLMLRELGFELAISYDEGLIYDHHAGDRWTLPRVTLTPALCDPTTIGVVLSGAPHRLSERLSRRRKAA